MKNARWNLGNDSNDAWERRKFLKLFLFTRAARELLWDLLEIYIFFTIFFCQRAHKNKFIKHFFAKGYSCVVGSFVQRVLSQHRISQLVVRSCRPSSISNWPIFVWWLRLLLLHRTVLQRAQCRGEVPSVRCANEVIHVRGCGQRDLHKENEHTKQSYARFGDSSFINIITFAYSRFPR